MNTEKSLGIFNESIKYIPGGVNSPVRSFKSVGGNPLIIEKGRGSSIWDADGNQYIDYVGSWGPLILGHSHPKVIHEVQQAIYNGLSFGAPTVGELDLCRIIVEAFPSMDKVRLVNSGTEATMSALRLARAATGKDKIIKFAGCYHGHSDGLLVEAGSGSATYSTPNSAGVPASYAGETLIARYNDLNSVEKIFSEYRGQIAGIIVEPIAANMGVVVPAIGFLQGLRYLADQNESLLIYDEVITGFRLTYGGAQNLYDVYPDITCLGKIIGGGLPVGAYGASSDLMEYVSPLGSMYQAGTLSGNPIAVTAGLATLNILKDQNIYNDLEVKSDRLSKSITEEGNSLGINIQVNRVGSLMTIFFSQGSVDSWDDVINADQERYTDFFIELLRGGVYIAPSPFEAMFVSAAHSMIDIDKTISVIRSALSNM
ncbi:MAG: glutamate-1-semialdehyde 2,1-aminomutase [Dehalococcoidia bacterium]|nr:glutamate-1-semialdehyde 2,1-aminomutase [Dehalococcoidia bacterium]